MSFRQLARKVVNTVFNICSTTNIGTGTGGVSLVASLTGAVEAIQYYNGTTSVIALCTGTLASPVPQVLCGPGLSQIIPTETLFPKGAALLAVAQDASASTGTFAVNLLAG